MFMYIFHINTYLEQCYFNLDVVFSLILYYLIIVKMFTIFNDYIYYICA